MWVNIVIIALKILLFVAIFKTIHLLMGIYKEQNVIESLVESFEGRYRDRIDAEEKRKKIEGNAVKESFYSHVDDLLDRAGMLDKFNFLTTEMYIVMVVSVAFLLYYLTKLIVNFWAFNIIVSLITLFLGYYIVYYRSGKVYEKIDDNIMNFVNNIESFSNTSTDIVTIFENIIPYTDYPLSKYLQEFVNIAKSSGDSRLAFNRLERRLENEKVKSLLKNLDIASRHNANYSEIIKEARKIFSGYFEARIRRQIEISNARTTLGTILVIGAAMLFGTDKFTGGILVSSLSGSLMGSILILAGILLFIWALWTFISMDRG